MSGAVALDAAEALFRSDKDRVPVIQKARRETGLRLVTELRVAHTAYDALVKFHDTYAGPDPAVRGALYRILAAWDGMPGQHTEPSTPDRSEAGGQ